MTDKEKYREIGLRLQKKYPKIDLIHHFTNCNVDDPVALGTLANDESNIWSKMLEDAHWISMGTKLQEI